MKPGYLGNRSAQAGPQHTVASHQRTLPRVRLPARLDTRARQKVGPAGRHCSSFTTLRFCVAARQERLLAMLQKVIILVFTALASSFLWWRTDSRYVGGVDHV